MRDEHDGGINTLDDLPGRVQLVAVIAFFAGLAALTQIPRLWGHEWLWQHFYLVAPLVGVAWWPLTTHFGSRWAKRLKSKASRTSKVSASARRTASPTDDEIVRRARRTAYWYTIRRGVAWLAVPVLIAVYLAGTWAADEDQRLIDTQPHQTAVVVAVSRSPLERHQGPDVTVELQGWQPITLGLSFPGDDNVEVGDRLVVVQDPDNPGSVIAVNSHRSWVYTTWGSLIIYLPIVAILLFFLFGGMPDRRAVRAARRARSTTMVTVESVADDGTVRLRDPGGDNWEWPADEEWPGDRTGPARALGKIQAGGWALLHHAGYLLWPAGPLRDAPPSTDLTPSGRAHA